MMRASENPFAVQRVEAVLGYRPEWAGLSWDGLEEGWVEGERRGVVVGRHGVGKSTLLESWASRLEASGQEVVRLFFNEDRRSLSKEEWGIIENLRGDEVVVIDGVEQLGVMARWRLYGRLANMEDGGVLVCRHGLGWWQVVDWWFFREGYVCDLGDRVEGEVGLELARICVREVSEGYAEVFSEELEGWLEECEGNVRELLLRCYDEVARRG